MTSISTHTGIHGPISRSGPGSNLESADSLINDTVGKILRQVSGVKYLN